MMYIMYYRTEIQMVCIGLKTNSICVFVRDQKGKDIGIYYVRGLLSPPRNKRLAIGTTENICLDFAVFVQKPKVPEVDREWLPTGTRGTRGYGIRVYIDIYYIYIIYVYISMNTDCLRLNKVPKWKIEVNQFKEYISNINCCILMCDVVMCVGRGVKIKFNYSSKRVPNYLCAYNI